MSGVWETTGYSGGLSRTEFADGEDQYQYAQNIDTRTDMRTARLSAARENVRSGDAMVVGNRKAYRFFTANGKCYNFNGVLVYDVTSAGVPIGSFNPASDIILRVFAVGVEIWCVAGRRPFVVDNTHNGTSFGRRAGTINGPLNNSMIYPRAFVPTNSTPRFAVGSNMVKIVSTSTTNDGKPIVESATDGSFNQYLVGLRRYIDSWQLVGEDGHIFGYDVETKKGLYDAPAQGDIRIGVSFNEYMALLKQRGDSGAPKGYFLNTGSLRLASGLQQQMLYSYTPNFNKFNFTGFQPLPGMNWLAFKGWDHVMCANLNTLYIAAPEGLYSYGSRNGERNHINLEYVRDHDGIGYVFYYGEHLYVSYKKGPTYYLDKINTTANNTKYAQTGYIRSNVYDAGNRTVAKSIDRVMISYDKLSPGDTISLYAILDRGAKHHIGTIDHTYHQQRKIRETGNYPWCQQWYDLEYEVVLTSANGTTTPVLRDVLFFWSLSNDPK